MNLKINLKLDKQTEAKSEVEFAANAEEVGRQKTKTPKTEKGNQATQDEKYTYDINGCRWEATADGSLDNI